VCDLYPDGYELSGFTGTRFPLKRFIKKRSRQKIGPPVDQLSYPERIGGTHLGFDSASIISRQALLGAFKIASKYEPREVQDHESQDDV
jgi:hypothetical protein